MIENGNTVDLHYTGKLSNGEIFDSSVGRSPLKVTVGSNQVITGFENAILGKNVGDKVSVTIQPEQAYGSIREDLFVKVPLDKMPGDVSVGQILNAAAQNGQPIQVKVKEVNTDHVVIDGNHPLAGLPLTFEIEVVSIS